MFAFNPVPFAVLTAALLSAAVGAGRGRATVAAGVAIVGAGATSQILKPLLAVPRADADVVAPASWPSGHATAGMSFALALVLPAPARLRTPAAPAGGGLARAAGYRAPLPR